MQLVNWLFGCGSADNLAYAYNYAGSEMTFQIMSKAMHICIYGCIF